MKKLILSILMLSIMLVMVGVVSAVHVPSVEVSPSGWLKPSTNYDFDFTVENAGPDSINEVTIQKPGDFANLGCVGDPDWSLSNTTDYCRYTTSIIEDFISSGESKTFSLDADTTTSGTKTWLITTRESGGVGTQYTNVDSIVKTIQSAIDDATAEDTINVPAGTYEELITIDKPLILQGAGVGNTIIDMSILGNPSIREKVILVDIVSGNVTIDGFEIILGDNMDGIDSSPGDSSSTLTISNNKITGYGSVACDDAQDFGIIIQDTKTDVVISNNEINTNCNPILLERAEGESDISWNTLYAKANSAGIFLMTLYGIDVTALQNIHDNTITILEAGTGGIGVRTSPSWTVASNGKFTNIEIADNTITGIDSGNNYAIKILNDKDDGTPETAVINGTIISGNTITGSNGTGIILGGLVVDTIINDNTISGVNEGIHMDDGNTDDYPTGTLVNENSITNSGTYGLNWLGSETLNAKNNDWGVTLYADVLALISGYVDFIPWLPADTTSPVIVIDGPYLEQVDVEVTVTARITDDRALDRYSISFEDGGYAEYNVTGDWNTSVNISHTYIYTSIGTKTVRITVWDKAGNPETIEETTVVIDDYDWLISLEVGWNLISIPLIPEDTSINEVFADIYDNIASEGTTYTIYQYDATYGSDGRWYRARKDGLGGFEATSRELTKIVPGYAYWIKMENPDILYGAEKDFAPNEIPIPSVDLETASWNLIGRYGISPNDLNLSIAFELLESNYFENNVLEYNNGWSAADSIDSGEGYWLRTTIVPELDTIAYEPGSYYFDIP